MTTKTITQTVKFKNASAKDVYGIFMNSKKHGAATGAPAEISKKAGEKWKAYKGAIYGKTLLTKPNKMVVQTWRARGWKADSILTLQFDDTSEGCEVRMVHAMVPEEQVSHVKPGWNKMYWNPLKAYIKSNGN